MDPNFPQRLLQDRPDDSDDATLAQEPPEITPVYRPEDLEWQDLQRDCSLFPAYYDAVYGPDLRDAENGGYTYQSRSEMLGTHHTQSSAANQPSSSLTDERNWMHPEDIAAQALQARFGANRAFHLAEGQPQSRPALQTPSSIPQPSNFPHQGLTQSAGQTTSYADPAMRRAAAQITPSQEPSQVLPQERRNMIEAEWVPAIWGLLKVKQQHPQESSEYQLANQQLESLKNSVTPEEANFITQCIYNLTLSENQAAMPSSG